MPSSIGNLVSGSVSRGVSHVVRSEVDRYTHPKIAEKVGFGVGFTILAVGLLKKRRADQLKRIEQKLDEVSDT